MNSVTVGLANCHLSYSLKVSADCVPTGMSLEVSQTRGENSILVIHTVRALAGTIKDLC